MHYYYLTNMLRLGTSPQGWWILEERKTSKSDDSDTWLVIHSSSHMRTVLQFAMDSCAKRSMIPSGEMLKIDQVWETWGKLTQQLTAPFRQTVELAWDSVEERFAEVFEVTDTFTPRTLQPDTVRALRGQFQDDTDVQVLLNDVEHLLMMSDILELEDLDTAMRATPKDLTNKALEAVHAVAEAEASP